MKKNHCNLQCGNGQLMCSKFKTCVMPHNQGLRARMWTLGRNGSNLKAKMFLDNNISIYQVHQTLILQTYQTQQNMVGHLGLNNLSIGKKFFHTHHFKNP
jgi:hypothetical protein